MVGSVITDRFVGVTASLAIKVPCSVAAVSNVTLSAAQTVNGIAVTTGDRVLCTAQDDAVENGIWIVGSAAWSRSPDMDGQRDITTDSLVVCARSGAQDPAIYHMTSAMPLIVGVDENDWEIFVEGASHDHDSDYSAIDHDHDDEYGGGSFVGVGLWTFRTETSTPPASGQIRFNHATIESATLLYVHETNTASDDMSWLLSLLGRSALMYIQDRDDATNYTVLEISSNTDSGAYRTFGIDNVVHVGTGPAQDAVVAIMVSHVNDPTVSEINVQNGNYTTDLADAGQTISKESGGAGETFTIDSNANVAYPVGTFIGFNNDGGDDLTIAITSDTLIWADDNTTGSRTIADGGYAVAQKVTTTSWKIAGKQIT